MKYMGSKARIAKEILPLLKEYYLSNDCEIFIDACCGGCNLIDKVDFAKNKYANDINKYLISMFTQLQNGWVPEDYYEKSFYADVKANITTGKYPDYIVGYVGFNCSYSGKWFGGFAGVTKTKSGTRNYQIEAKRNVLKQMNNLKDVRFTNKSVFDIEPSKKSLIYFDIPYKGTTGYKDSFNHELFYQKCAYLQLKGNIILVSEYEMPVNFKELWSGKVKSSLSANGRCGSSKESIEKLYILS